MLLVGWLPLCAKAAREVAITFGRVYCSGCFAEKIASTASQFQFVQRIEG